MRFEVKRTFGRKIVFKTFLDYPFKSNWPANPIAFKPDRIILKSAPLMELDPLHVITFTTYKNLLQPIKPIHKYIL